MQYRDFGRLHWQPSALGFGAMRLPVLDNDSSKIDEPEATRMIRYAIDQGVNYVDTAYPYHGGNSEKLVGRALQDGYRERVKLATKLPCWEVKKTEDFDRLLNEQLERLQTEHIDFYLLHALNEKSWATMRELNILDEAEKALAAGRIHYLGFSFHDEYEVFEKIIDGYDAWCFCQIQYNYMDVELQAGTRGLRYAYDKGLAVVVMEPIRGGQLAIDPPPPIMELWDTAAHKRAPADWALQWAWNQPQVSVVLSGMSTMEHVKQNVASACVSGPDTLTDAERELIARVRDKYQELVPIPCTDCKYCLPCPEGVSIPHILSIYNESVMYNTPEKARRFYSWVEEAERADQCVQCGECEEKCPQGIGIMEWLEKIHQALGEGKHP